MYFEILGFSAIILICRVVSVIQKKNYNKDCKSIKLLILLQLHKKILGIPVF